MPFLVTASIPTTGVQPDSYTISGLPSSPVTSTAFTNTDGSKQLKYDLSPVANGSYTVNVTASNQWGTSAASSPFSFVKAAPGTPTLLTIVVS
jgi:hypothetical protein